MLQIIYLLLPFRPKPSRKRVSRTYIGALFFLARGVGGASCWFPQRIRG